MEHENKALGIADAFWCMLGRWRSGRLRTASAFVRVCLLCRSNLWEIAVGRELLCCFRSAKAVLPLPYAALAALLLVGADSGVRAQQALEARSWGPEGSPYKFDHFDCAKEKVRSLTITGSIELRHPKDSADASSAPEMTVECEEIFFAKDSRIVSEAALRIQANKVMGGQITIHTVRSRKGADGADNEDIYKVRAKPDKPPAGNGGNGDHASDDPFDSHGSDDGGRGGDGERGDDGDKGLKGSDGRQATKAARIILYARTYATNTVVNLTSIGADGGKGRDGGRGQNGGRGGNGGAGGSGGNASFLKSASRGGDGGNGGDGGTGGTGGPGGKGGDAANGGDLYVLVIVSDPTNPGNAPGQYIWSNDGGKGGEPGNGGQGGTGGEGGSLGLAGCGGRPKNIGDWQVQPGARCGGQGRDGRRGVDGGSGLAGEFGKDGVRGEQGTNKMAYIKDPALGAIDWAFSPVAVIDDPTVLPLPMLQFSQVGAR